MRLEICFDDGFLIAGLHTYLLGNPTLTMMSQLCVMVNEKEAPISHQKSPETVLPSSRT